MNDTVTMAHGAGGKQTSELIQKVFRAHFENPYFTADDASVLPAPKGRIAMTTDGFIVSPHAVLRIWIMLVPRYLMLLFRLCLPLLLS